MLFETVDSLGSLEAAKVPLFHTVSFVKFSFLFQNQGVSYHETYLTCLDFHIQCNLDLVTLILVTTCDLVTIFVETKSVTKSRLHCIMSANGLGGWVQKMAIFACGRSELYL